MSNNQATLDGFGLIVLSKTGKPMCRLCGHYLTDKSHPSAEGTYRFTIWCPCICIELYDRKGRPKQLSPMEIFRLQIHYPLLFEGVEPNAKV